MTTTEMVPVAMASVGGPRTEAWVVQSPIGPLALEGTDDALIGITLPPVGSQSATAASLASTAASLASTAASPASTVPPNRIAEPEGWHKIDLEGSESSEPPAAVRQTATQLAEYFCGARTTFELPLVTTVGTAFQRRVWWALAEIPFGQTISYADLADRVGRPRAFRAVGQANGANPFPIVLPCHRVLASGGRIGGYGGGLTMKRALLSLEGITVP